jgi:hypothetical protein
VALYKPSSVRQCSASTAARPKLSEATSDETPNDVSTVGGSYGGESMAYLAAVVLAGALLLGLTLIAAGNSP